MFRIAPNQSSSIHRRLGITAGAAAIAIFTAAGHADLVDIIVPDGADFYEVDVEFVGSSAGWTGDFYFLGHGTSNSIEEYAENTNDAELGQWLLNNHSSTAGDLATLDAIFEAGDELHFAYDVYKNGNPIDLFRTDLAADAPYFEWDEESLMLGIEDIRGDNSDWDFNDVQMRFTFREVPTPAAAVLFALAGCSRTRRRR